MPDFNDVLNLRVDQVEKPKARPTGTYMAVVQGLPKHKKVTPKAGGDDMDVVTFVLKRTGEVQVDRPEDMEAHPPVSEWSSMTHDIFVHTEGGQYALRQFLENTLGMDVAGKTFKELLAEAGGKQLLVKTKHEPYMTKDNQPDVAERIESTAHV